MCANSLRLVDRKTRKSRQSSMRTSDGQSSIIDIQSNEQSSDRMLYGGIFDFLKKKKKSDEELQEETSEYYAQTEEPMTMDSYIQDMISQLTIGDTTQYSEAAPEDVSTG